ncbi:MAG: tetratricopeptide repeat protein [Elusimicrobiales bacterium]|nr:tetratricopeptide repeat protein [Elusimicrobiales bacterium]
MQTPLIPQKLLNAKAALAALLLLSALALSPALKAGFVNWDDNFYVTENPAITTLSPENVKHIFSSFQRGLYTPLTVLSFAAEYKLAGLNPALYHATNLALHLANCALVFLLVTELGAGLYAAFFIALFFGLHPVNVESVAWVSERKELLHALFCLGALYSYARWIKSGDLRLAALSPLLFALGLMGKPQSVWMPFALVFIDFAAGRKFDRRAVCDKLAFIALALSFGGMAFLLARKIGVIYHRPGFGFYENLCVAAYGLLSYLARLVLPVKLCAIYPYPQVTAGRLPFAFAWAPLSAAVVVPALLYAARKDRRVLAGILFFIAAAGPGLQLLPVAPSVAFDHYAYLPYIGLLCAAAAGAENLIAARPETGKPVFAAAWALAAVFGVMSFMRAQVWHDPLSLWNDVIAKYPRTSLAYSNRAVALAAENKAQQALQDLDKALELQPDNTDALANRCGLYLARGKDDIALRDCDRALALAPNISGAWQNRGLIYLKRRDYAAALENFNNAIRAKPLSASAWMSRALLYEAAAKPQKALDDYMTAMRLNPLSAAAKRGAAAVLAKAGDSQNLRRLLAGEGGDPQSAQAYMASGEGCLENGNYRCAAGELSQALNLGADAAKARTMRAAAYGALGMLDNSLEDYAAALLASPDYIDAYYNRGFMFIALKRYDEAKRDMDKVISLKPDSGGAYLNRGGICLATGKYKEAVSDLTKAADLRYSPASTLTNRALAYRALGDIRAALADLSKVLALNPEHENALLLRAEINLMPGGDRRAAAADLDRLLSLNPRNAPALALRAKTRADKGK